MAVATGGTRMRPNASSVESCASNKHLGLDALMSYQAWARKMRRALSMVEARKKKEPAEQAAFSSDIVRFAGPVPFGTTIERLV